MPIKKAFSKVRLAKGVISIPAFACDQCLAAHTLLSDAAACCRCTICETKFPHEGTYGSVCGHCSYGSQLRDACASVRRARERLAEAEKRLEQLLSSKRPPKGSAVS